MNSKNIILISLALMLTTACTLLDDGKQLTLGGLGISVSEEAMIGELVSLSVSNSNKGRTFHWRAYTVNNQEAFVFTEPFDVDSLALFQSPGIYKIVLEGAFRDGKTFSITRNITVLSSLERERAP